MEKKHKAYLKLNIVSLFFVAVSFISITLAWFAYSGLATVDTTINVKAWHIDFDSSNSDSSNNIIVSLSSIYPGMDTVNESITIKNLGDSDAELNYSIVSARILDDTYQIDELHSLEYIQDRLSHEYPFHINMSLNKNYILSKNEDGVFNVSVSWPLDSGTDEFDSEWGNKAYNFQANERALASADPNYKARSTIKIEISLNAEQMTENLTSPDVNYNLGDLILYDVVNNRSCETISDTCIRTNVIDFNSKIGDKTVSLLPDLDTTFNTGTYNNFDTLMATNTTGWKAVTRNLHTSDLLNIISNDITNSLLVRNNISDTIIGYLKYNGRMETEMTKVSNFNGYYTFKNPNYIYFSTGNCYWTKDSYGVDNSKAFAFKRIDLNISKIYGEDVNTNCGVVPVIVATKTDL